MSHFDAKTEAIKLLDKLSQDFPTKKPITLEWRRYRTTAGTAHPQDNRIALSINLMSDLERLSLTLKHEYAHLLACDRFGPKARGHGPAWQAAMIELGLEPKVKHTYECVRNQRAQKVIYRCKACNTELETARRLPKRRKYTHKGCGGAIEFLRVDRISGPS